MNRRDFVRLAGSGISATALAETIVEAQVARSPAPVRPSPPLKMHVGTQQGDSEEMLRAFAAFGVNNICGSLPSKKLDDAWSVEALSTRRERVDVARHLARHGAAADELVGDLAAPRCRRSILGTNPERDRNIDDICQMIRNCARAGIMQVKYNFTLLGVVAHRHRAGPRHRRATASSSTPARSRIRR